MKYTIDTIILYIYFIIFTLILVKIIYKNRDKLERNSANSANFAPKRVFLLEIEI